MTSQSSHDSRHRERLDTGLYRRITRNGETRYDVAVWHAGRQQVRAMPPGASEREARRAALRARAAAIGGANHMPAALRFATLADEYLKSAEARTRIVGKGSMSERTVANYRYSLRTYVNPTIGRRKLSELGKRDVLRIIDVCHDARLADWTTHGVLTAFRAVLRYGRETDLMTADPFIGIPRDRLPAQRATKELFALRPSESTRLLSELRAPQGRGADEARLAQRDYTLGSLLADAGLRISEALGLRWMDVSFEDRSLHVRGQLALTRASDLPRIVPPKSRRGLRVVPLLPRLEAALEALYDGQAQDSFVLRTGRGTPLSRHNAARTIRNAGRRAGLGNVTPQVLRRTLGTALSEAVPVAASAAILGHSVEVNHRAYVKARRDRLERDQAREALLALGIGLIPAEEPHEPADA